MSNVIIAGTASGATALPVANSVDGSLDYIPIYTNSATATQAITRNTYLNIASNPVGISDSQTLTNKTITAPNISSPVLSGTITGTYTIGGTPTFPSSVVTLTGSQTLTNKVLTSPTINSPTITNATISTDVITGFSASTSGTLYGVSYAAGAISSVTTLTTTGTITAGSGLTMSAGALTLTGTWDGWVAATGSWSYASASSPEFTITVPSDATTYCQAGDRIKLTQSATVKYFIITKVASTTLTVYGGTDYTLANAAISSPAVSRSKSPFGFPLDPTKWTVRNVYTDDNTTTSASYAQVGSHQIVIPTGAWRVTMQSIMRVTLSGVNNTAYAVALSTATNSAADSDFVHVMQNPVVSGISGNQTNFLNITKNLTVASATTYYQVHKTSIALTSTVLGSAGACSLEAVCAYL